MSERGDEMSHSQGVEGVSLPPDEQARKDFEMMSMEDLGRLHAAQDRLTTGERLQVGDSVTLVDDTEVSHDELIEARRAVIEQMIPELHRDPLTRLSNRLGFEAALTRPENAGKAVVYLDLDGFKKVNDSLGHAAGDMVLQVVGERLVGIEVRMRIEEQVEGYDERNIARIGGDEIALIVPVEKLDLLVELIKSQINFYVMPGSRPIVDTLTYEKNPSDRLSSAIGPVTVSVGVGYDLDPAHPDVAVQEADAAMYEDKKRRQSGER